MRTPRTEVTGEEVYVALDLGTSSLKAVAVTAGGTVAASAKAPYATRRPTPGAAEQDPRDWISALEAVVGRILSAIPAERWRCLSLTGMMPTLVTTDSAGLPTGAAITWEDARADDAGEALRALAGPDSLYELTGQWVDGRYLVPMYLRAAADEPTRSSGATLVLSAKDYLFGWLTGEPSTDPSTAAGFGCYELATGQWLPEVVDLAEQLGGFRLPAFPPVLSSATLRPLETRASGRLGIPAGLPVCLGGADSALGALGLGVSKVGDVAYVAGSSTVILALSDRLALDPRHRYLVTPLAGIDGWGLEMDLLSTGSAIAWLGALVMSDEEGEAGVMKLAATAEPGEGPVMLPYLAPGEQGAIWDASLRGAILGVHLGHEARHLARGLIDGILLESRRCLAVLDDAGLPRGEVRVAGGSATDPHFRAQLADATGRVVVSPSDGETRHSALGAAALAASALDGIVLLSGRRGATTVDRPDRRQAALFDALSLRHEQALAAVQAFSHAVADPGPPGSEPGLPEANA